jgi:GT2 family glycosyltransferase
LSTPTSRPALWVLVLCYNQIALTLECLATLAAQTHPAHVLVIDNASSDGTAEQVARHFPNVEILRLATNLGYAGGNNAAMRHALACGAEAMLLLNNDTRLAPTCLAELVAALDAHPEAAAIGPMVYTWDGWDTISSAGGIINWAHADAVNVGAGEPDSGQYAARAVDFLNGCALLVRSAAAAQVGLLDEHYFMYWEETDWCARMRHAGWTLRFEPAARVQHKAPLEPEAMSRAALYYMARNRLLFFARHTPWARRPVVMARAVHGVARGGLRARRQGTSSALEQQALRDFALRRFGQQHALNGEW